MEGDESAGAKVSEGAASARDARSSARGGMGMNGGAEAWAWRGASLALLPLSACASAHLSPPLLPPCALRCLDEDFLLSFFLDTVGCDVI